MQQEQEYNQIARNNETYCIVNLKIITIFCTIMLSISVILLSFYFQYVITEYNHFQTYSNLLSTENILFRNEFSNALENLQKCYVPNHQESERNEIIEPLIDVRDFALESLGGQIESTGETKLYEYPIQDYIWSYLFNPLMTINQTPNSPRNIIQPNNLPGNCYGFYGSNGEVIVKLMDWVYVSSIAIEHISPEESPTGNINTAPAEFSVFGLRSPEDENPFEFGTFYYEIYAKNRYQKFSVENVSNESFLYIHFKFLTNHGNKLYTCVYRTLVHGQLKNYISETIIH